MSGKPIAREIYEHGRVKSDRIGCRNGGGVRLE